MKSQIIVGSLLLALTFAAPLLVRADDPPAPAATDAPPATPAAAPAAAEAPPAPAAGPAAAAAEEHTDLEKKMMVINRAVRKLKTSVKDPANNQDSLALVAKIREAAVAATEMVPAKEKELPEADQAKFQADYQTGMKAFIDQVDQLTAALTANDNDQASKIFQELIATERKDHKAFRKPENK